jgi:hypothetical protein
MALLPEISACDVTLLGGSSSFWGPSDNLVGGSGGEIRITGGRAWWRKVSHVAIVELQGPKMISDGAYLVWTDLSVNVSAKRGKPARPILVGAIGTGLDSTMCTETGLTSVCARFAQRTPLVIFYYPSVIM